MKPSSYFLLKFRSFTFNKKIKNILIQICQWLFNF